jgi:hypothetical protein
MKNCYTLFFIFCWCTNLLSQEQQSFELTGTIFSDSLAIENAHIINKRTLKGTITNSKGMFMLPVKVRDTLLVSHINYTIAHVVVSIAEKATKKTTIQLHVKTHTLNEISLKKRKSIFYVDPEIMPAAIVNATTLKLPYANVIAKKDEAISKLTFTSAAVNLDNLINYINGNTKKAKELKEVTLKDHKLDQIRKKYTDHFFIHQLKIEKQYINLFLNYCLNSGILSKYRNGNALLLTQLLIAESKTFPHKQIDEDTLLSKQ